LLPAQRGKGTSFWNIIEESPFGATIHKIGKKIDDGDIVAQVEITKTWEDTGGSLAVKSQIALSDLFKSWYPNLSGNESIQIHNKIVETFHLLREIPAYSSLELDATTTVRNLLNLLRAKVHEDYPGCTFTDEGKVFEVQIQIKEITHG
jgi:methionyl-tRNA formyltransferase